MAYQPQLQQPLGPRIAALNLARRGQSIEHPKCAHCGSLCVDRVILGVEGAYCSEGCQREGDYAIPRRGWL